MIQSRWIDQQPSEFTSVVPSAGLSNNARSLLKHNRDSKFSNRIIRHGGPAISQSMDASARTRKFEKSALRKSSNSVDSLTADFEKEAASLILLHQKFLRDQQLLELEAKKFFAARTIQCMFRKWKARRMLGRLKARRFLSYLIYFRRYFKRRLAASKIIVQAARTFRIRRHYFASVTIVRAAKRIQRKYRAFRIRRSTSTFMVRCGVLKNMMRHVMLFGSRKAYHHIKQLRFLLAHGKERVAVKNLVNAWRRRRRAQVFSGPNGKMAYLTLAYLNTTIEYMYNPYYNKRRIHVIAPPPTILNEGELGAAPATPATPEVEVQYAPPPTPSEPHYSNMVIDYIKHKVEIQHAIEQQSRRKHQGGRHLYQSKRPLHVRGKVVMLPTNSIEQSALANVLTGEKMVYAQDNHRHFSKEEIARLGYGGKLITPMYTRDQLPDEMTGLWGPKSFADVILMIVDMKRIAVDNPNLVDDGSLTGAAASPIVSRMSGKFKRREHNGKAYFVNQFGESVEAPRLNSPSAGGNHRDSNMSVMSTMSSMSNSSVTPSHRVLDSAGSKNGNRFNFPEEPEIKGVGDGKRSAKNMKSTPKGGASTAGKKPDSATNGKKQTPKAGSSLPSDTLAAAGGGTARPGKQVSVSATIHEEDHRNDPHHSTSTKSGVSSVRISSEFNPEDLTLTMPLGSNSGEMHLTPLSAAFKQTFGFLNSAKNSFTHSSSDGIEPESEVPEVELNLPTKSIRFANDFVMKARTTALMLKIINNAHAPTVETVAAPPSAASSAAAEATRGFISQARSSLVLVNSAGSEGAAGGLSTTKSFMSGKTITNKASDVTGDILKAARRSVMQTTLNERKRKEPEPEPPLSLEAIARIGFEKFTTVKNSKISFSSTETATSLTDGFLLKARSSVMVMPSTPPGKPSHVTKKAAAFSMAPTVTLESLSLLYDTSATITEEAEEEHEPALVMGSELDGNSVVELPVGNHSSEYSMNFTGMLGSLVDDPDFNIQLENSDFAIQIGDTNVDEAPLSPLIDHLKSKLPVVGKGQSHAKPHETVAPATLPHIKPTVPTTTATSGSGSRPTSGAMVTHYPDIHLSDDEGAAHKSALPTKPANFKPAKPVAYHITGEVRSRPGRKIV